MAYKTILTVTGIDQGDRDLNIAIELCGQIGAHLSVFAMALAVMPAMSDVAMNSYVWALEHQPDMDRLKARVASVTNLLAGSSVSADVSSDYPDTAWADEIVGRRARYADLVVVGPELLRAGTMKSKAVEGTLFWSGRPVLLVPEGSHPTLQPKRVLVAWDSSLEASRAVREAIEMLGGAESVHVCLVDPAAGEFHQGSEPGADVAAYLARHGAKVSVDRLPSSGRPIAEVLSRHAADVSADLIVMGAYGHSRLRERIFGGVTKSMLDQPPMPVLMAR
jgi:nucleotide-binding universal stress UspA family protein